MFQGMSMYFDSLNTVELPIFECNSVDEGHLDGIWKVNTNKNLFKISEIVMQNKPPILKHRSAKSPNFCNIDPRRFKKISL